MLADDSDSPAKLSQCGPHEIATGQHVVGKP
jgi:hypothetical protein